MREHHLESPFRRPAPRSGGRPNPYMELSLTGRSAVPASENANLLEWMSGAADQIMPSPSPRRDAFRHQDPRSNKLNVVDIDRIRIGLDVRTTVSVPKLGPV